MADQISLSEWLNDQLRKHNLSQTELAKKANISRSVITRIAQNEIIKPSPQTCLGLAKALDVSPITVYRIAGLLPPDSDFPELEEYKYVLGQLSPESRKAILVMVKALAKEEKKAKGSSFQE